MRVCINTKCDVYLRVYSLFAPAKYYILFIFAHNTYRHTILSLFNLRSRLLRKIYAREAYICFLVIHLILLNSLHKGKEEKSKDFHMNRLKLYFHVSCVFRQYLCLTYKLHTYVILPTLLSIFAVTLFYFYNTNFELKNPLFRFHKHFHEFLSLLKLLFFKAILSLLKLCINVI